MSLFVYKGGAHTAKKGVYEMWGIEFPINQPVSVESPGLAKKLSVLGCFEECGPPKAVEQPIEISEAPEPPVVLVPDYDSMTRDELKSRLTAKGEQFSSFAHKKTLVKLLKSTGE